MSEPFVFDSRCELCKSPYGAVPCGGAVYFHVRPLASERFSHCALVCREEFSGQSRERELSCDGPEGDRIRFSLALSAPPEPELVWYHFRLWRDDGSGCLLDRSGYRSQGAPDAWQMTVYRNTRPAPAWFGEGVTYQIFPDSFCRLSRPDPSQVPAGRRIHASWDEPPQWRPDPDGEVRRTDFYGGSLAGILSRLDDLEALGVSALYLCPIFESDSNHRYNTGNYRKIDPLLGTEEDFCLLCREAHRRKIRVILDGVFNHTGSNSLYFNAEGHYPSLGAAQSRESPYFPWYRFSRWPDQYECWWGIRTLPAVDEENPDYRRFIADGEDSVVRHWLRCGADGWRLDVADELPDDFIARIRDAVESVRPDGLLLGEVWEDGSTKVAYGRRRRYLLGDETHGLMNYPFRTAALSWLRGDDAADFCETMETLREHYPAPAFASAMNFLGTHDTPRILTLLGCRQIPDTREARAAYRLDAAELARGTALLRVAAALLYAFPGSPTVFYGDEAGMQGFEDPLNRAAYPWGREDRALWAWFAQLGRLRRDRASLRRGSLRWLCAAGGALAFVREWEGETTLAALNAGPESRTLTLPWAPPSARDALSGQTFVSRDGALRLALPPQSAFLLTE